MPVADASGSWDRHGGDHGLAPLSPRERAKGWLVNSHQPSMS